MRGRWLVIGVMALGVVLAVVASVMRGRRGATLPLKPGTVLVITVGHGHLPLGPFASEAIEFAEVHGVSSQPAATRGALLSGRMPRDSGLVREGDTLRSDVATFPELMQQLGFESRVFKSGDGEAGAAGEQGVSWMLERGSAPTLALLHLDAWNVATAVTAATAPFLERLAQSALGERLVLVVVELEDLERPRLALRVPGHLLPPETGAGEVSLLDVAPTLLELYGIEVPTDWMEPFLLRPRTHAPRFFLYTDPLPAPDLDVDAVTLCAADFVYRCDPRGSPGESVLRRPPMPRQAPHLLLVADDDAAIAVELRRILSSAYGYRIEGGCMRR